MKSVKLVVLAMSLAVLAQSCGTGDSSSKKASVEEKKKVPPKIAVVESAKPKVLNFSLKKTVVKKSEKITLESGGIEVTNSNLGSSWKIKAGSDIYDFSPYPLVKTKAITVLEDSSACKTVRMTSIPYDKKELVLTQEVTAVKGFPGFLFKIKRKNLGSAPVLTVIGNYLSMKKGEYATCFGKQAAGGPWEKKRSIKNWIYLPAKNIGLGLVMNYSKPGMSFISNLGRKDKKGKRINDTNHSQWGIRRKMKIEPGETEELIFALVAANSAEETALLAKRIQNEKIFPDLILEKDSKKLVAKNKTKAVVKPITDPKQYSAEKTDAKTVEDWVKNEMPPEQFDIWYGKKDRQYLNGSWKFVKLAGTRENPDCKYGVEHGFQKPDFNDAEWFNQPVPFLWNIAFEARDGVRSKRIMVFGGVGWYRKNFFVPKKEKGKRIVLCFEAVDQECTVYVNGKEVLYHKTISVDKPMGLFGIQQDSFEVDVTDTIKAGEENTIAIRVYDNGRFKHSMYERLKSYRSGIGGIWQEVFLETRPSVYLKKAIASFDVEKSIMTIDACFINTEKKAVKENLSVSLNPWKSKRYDFAKGEQIKCELGKFDLRAGLNKLQFKVPLKNENPQLWSPESPYLYEMKIVNSKNLLLGRERIGLREMKIGKKYFYLNGNKITFRGNQAQWTSWSNAPGFRILADRMGLMNRRDAIVNWFDKYKALNNNIVRNHSTFYPHSFYDIADEKGIMAYIGYYFEPNAPFFDDNGKMTDFYKGKLRQSASNIREYPSIVLFSQKNESYDSKYIGKKIDHSTPYLNQIYTVLKENDFDIPITSSCGRPPTEESLNKNGTKPYAYAKSFAKTDFYAVHNYLMCWYDVEFAEDDDWYYGIKHYYDSYVLDDGPKAMWNTESIISSIPKLIHGHSKTIDKQFRPHVRDNMIDRKWFVENWKLIPLAKYAGLSLDRSVPKFGFLNTVLRDRSVHTQARFLKRVIELHRRKRDYCAGVVANDDQIFLGGQNPLDMGTLYNEPVAEAAKKANQPVLACLDGKWNRNIFSGENPPTPLYVMNDHESDISDVNVSVSLKNLDQKGKLISLKGLSLGKLTPAEMKTMDYVFDIPKDISSGHYQVVLEVDYSYKNETRKSINDYKTFILKRDDVKLNHKAKEPVALINLGVDIKETASMLKNLNVEFSIVKDLKNINKFKIAILPPNSPAASVELVKWVKDGAKLLCLSQQNVPEGLPQTIRAGGRYGFFTELILKTHPVLKGLEQSDFSYWNGARNSILNKWVVNNCFLPLNDGVIASMMTSGNRMGMSIAEYRLGKGVCLLSQVEAVKRFNTDSVATKYLVNTLDYCFGGWDAPGAPLIKAADKKIAAFQIDPKKAFSIDIAKQCTMGFTDPKAGDKKGGWTDQGPELDLHNLPTGKQVFNGVPFNIINPENNNGKSCIVLRGSILTKSEFLPLKKRITLNCKAQKLYFLISAAWVDKKKKEPIASIKISEEADGTEQFSFFQIDLVPGKNITDWWNAAAHKPPEAELGWVGLTGQNLKTYEVGSFILEWTNPTPKKNIQFIDFTSAGTSMPVILGITGVKP